MILLNGVEKKNIIANKNEYQQYSPHNLEFKKIVASFVTVRGMS